MAQAPASTARGDADGAAPDHTEAHQQHPLKIYFAIWGALFVLSLFSYLIDFFHVQGVLRWTLILIFMMGKAVLICAVFMHMMWERMALIYALLFPPVAILVFVGIMIFEANYTHLTRLLFFK